MILLWGVKKGNTCSFLPAGSPLMHYFFKTVVTCLLSCPGSILATCALTISSVTAIKMWHTVGITWSRESKPMAIFYCSCLPPKKWDVFYWSDKSPKFTLKCSKCKQQVWFVAEQEIQFLAMKLETSYQKKTPEIWRHKLQKHMLLVSCPNWHLVQTQTCRSPSPGASGGCSHSFFHLRMRVIRWHWMQMRIQSSSKELSVLPP